MDSTRQAALWYASQGWAVFPVWQIVDGRCGCGNPHCQRPGKHPVGFLVQNGLGDATTDQNQINSWWDKRPDWNIATASHFRIDVDTRHGGIDNWRDLVFEKGGYDPTPTCRTPSGGLHLYFLAGDDYGHTNQVGNLPDGIDVRGHGSGYTLLPPSNHIDGIYTWSENVHPKDTPIAEPPDWLIGLVGSDSEPVDRAEFSGAVTQVDVEDLQVSALVKAILQRDRSRIDHCVITSLVSAGLSDDEIRTIFQTCPPTAKYKEKNGQGDNYLAHSIGKARAWIKENTRPQRSRL